VRAEETGDGIEEREKEEVEEVGQGSRAVDVNR
jgi:hypothetical protein